MLLTIDRGIAQNELDIIRNNWLQYSDAPNSFYHFLTGEAFKMLQSRADKITQIKTQGEMLIRQDAGKLYGRF